MKQRTTPGQRLLSDGSGPILAVEGDGLCSEDAIVAVALALGVREVPGWSAAEERLASAARKASRATVADLRERIHNGEDPLGEAFCRLRLPPDRRTKGVSFTPHPIIDAMIQWATEPPLPLPHRVIDPGTGSGRYLVAAGRRFPSAALLGIEIDPLPAIMARANLAAFGFAERAEVVLGDYRAVTVPRIAGPTLYIGNPPYVRHHLIDARWKTWLIDEATGRGYSASQLAGLHVYFFLATIGKASKGDFGAFITAAEWLDVNYGSLVRELFWENWAENELSSSNLRPFHFPMPQRRLQSPIFRLERSPRESD